MDMDNIDNFVYYGETRVMVHNISAVCLASIKTIPSDTYPSHVIVLVAILC